MFPYPSGEGLHVGHPKGYIATDIYSRYKRMQGHNVLHPMGWDAFGLPAENYAIKNKIHPRVAVEKNIANFKEQLAGIGFDYDWEREINTTDPEYYKWTQWIFLQLFKKGLAYQSNEPINWCPSCMTGLANEDLDGTVCERCGTEVVKKRLPQWVLKITDYADRMLTDLDTLDWPEHIKTAQRNWIGKSEGAEIDFALKFTFNPAANDNRGPNGEKAKLTVFTTRPDTLFGATYLVLAPEHPWVTLATNDKHDVLENKEDVLGYIKAAARKTEIERAENKEKTGVEIKGVKAINPANGEEIPIYVADYVLGGYGTGAIMAVPAHDERDFEFAKKFDLPIISVIEPVTGTPQINPEFRKSIVAIVLDKKNNKVLTIHWGNLGGKLFIGGGQEEGEDVVSTALREIKEETGYSDLVFVSRTPTIHHSYFAHSKNVARNIDAIGLLFELTSEAREDQKLEVDEQGKFTVEWLDTIQAEKEVTEPLHNTVFMMLMQEKPYTDRGILVNSNFSGSKTKYLIFDFDGVIGDTFEHALASQVAMGYVPDIETARKNVLEYASNKPVHVRDHTLTPEKLQEEYDWTTEFGKKMAERNPGLFDEFILEILKLRNTKIAIVSSGSELYVKPATARTELNPTHILGFESHHSKEEKVELVCKEWGIDLSQVYYFTDTKADVLELENIIPKKQIIGCAWGYLGKEALESVLPKEQVLENFSDIHRLFTDLSPLDSKLTHTYNFNGLTSDEAKVKITEFVGGKMTSTYKLKDWVFSRQRYWGEPIPIVHCPTDGAVGVPESQLPVLLPEVKSYEPSGTGESPLAHITDWVNTTCPTCGGPAKRETNTMPQWAGSSWYYLRFIDPHNNSELASKEKLDYWMGSSLPDRSQGGGGVDVYVGGDHAVRHLIYARFWHKFLYDIGSVSTIEPFARLEFLGFILAEDGRKMSKRYGNVINPTEVVANHGADAFRIYEMFMAPFENTVAWSTASIAGTTRFVERVWRIKEKAQETPVQSLESVIQQTIKKVGDDIEAFKFNTAVSQMMILLNTIEKEGGVGRGQFELFLQLMAPFAPHTTEELWERLGHTESIHVSMWPVFDGSKLLASEQVVAVQVNGKVRGTLVVPLDTDENEVLSLAREDEKIAAWLKEGAEKKAIYIPGKVINFVIDMN